MVKRPAPLTVDANEDFLFGGAETQRWGGGIPLHPARFGEEVPADSRALSVTCESTPWPAQACGAHASCLSLTLPSRGGEGLLSTSGVPASS